MFRALDPRFPSLTFHCLVVYWVVCLTTLGITIASVVLQVQVYQNDCATYDPTDSSPYYGGYSEDTECIPGDIVVFALGLGVAVIAMVQSSIQLILFYKHRASPLRLLAFNGPVVVLWIVVIAIGWNPTNWTYDDSTGNATPNISGWLYTYSIYWSQESVGTGISNTLALAMGFAVMSIISFGLSTLLALYVFIVYHRNWRKQIAADREALVTLPKITEKTRSGSNPQVPEAVLLPPRREDFVSPTQMAVAASVLPQDRLGRSRSM